jgi:hypothetical protein
MLASPLYVLRRAEIIGVASLAFLLAAPAGLSASPLEKTECDKLQSEKQGLMVLGVDKEFAKGPDWAKANLGQAELNLLKRFLVLDEQLKFRCGLATVTLQIPDDPEDGPDGSSPAPGVSAPPVPPRKDQPAGAKPAPRPAAKPQQATTKAGAIPLPTIPGMPSAPAVKPAAPKPTAPKAQSSWNTETQPVDAVGAASVQQIEVKPRPERTRRIESGDGG